MATKKKKWIMDLEDQNSGGSSNWIFGMDDQNTGASPNWILNRNEQEDDKKWWQEIFQKPEVFDDGYDFGDISKTILGTAGDIGLGAVEGVLNVGDSVAKLISGGIAQVSDWVGADEFAQKIRTNLATKENPLISLVNKGSDTLNDYSVLGESGEKVANLVGYTGGLAVGGYALGGAANIPITVGGSTLNIPTLAAISGAGSSLAESYQNENVTDTQAWLRAFGSGTIEGVTEGLFGMFGVGGSGLDDMLSKEVANQFKSGAAKVLTNIGIKATGESVEEFLSYAGNQGLDWLIDKASKDGAKFYEDWNWEEVGEEMALAFISTGLSQGGSSVVNNTVQSNNAIKVAEEQLGRQLTTAEKNSIRNQVATALVNENTLNEQKVIDYIVNQESQNQNYTNKEIRELTNKITNDLREGNINTKYIENALGDVTTAWTNTQNQINELEQQLKNTNDNQSRKNIQNQIKKLQESLVHDSRLQRNYYERSQRSVNYAYELNDSDSEIARATKESAAKVMNNTTRTRNFVESVANIAEDTGTQYIFTNNEQLKAQGYEIKGKNIDGLVNDNGTVLINIDSPKALNKIIGHETTHLLENTPEYQELQDMAIAFAKVKGEYDNRLQTISEIYKGVKANILNEFTSDLVGDYIFDTKFLQELANQKPTLFQKIYNYIRHLANKVVAKSVEARELEDLKYKFQKVYLDAIKNKTTNSKANTQSKENVKYDIDDTEKNSLEFEELSKNQSKGNIPLQQDLFRKHSSAREMFDNATSNYDGEIRVETNIEELKNIDIENISVQELKKIANDIFNKYNDKIVYYNDGNRIVVNVSGINESVEKIFYNNRQKKLIKEHLQVFSDLGDIIEHATLVSQNSEYKGRKNIKSWNYYYDNLIINGKSYKLVFDVRSMDNGENQYRVQRLELDTKKTGDYDEDASNNTRILSSNSQPVSYSNDTTNKPKSQVKSGYVNASYTFGKQLVEGTYPSASVEVNNEILSNHQKEIKGVGDLQGRFTKFVNEHRSDFDNIPLKGVTSNYYVIDDNLVKLSTTTENNTIYIEELYVEKQRQGTGTKVVDSIVEYAKEKGYDVQTMKELETARGFWDKTLRNKSEATQQIQGLENYSVIQIKGLTRNYIEEKLLESNFDDINIKDIAIIGSRGRGNANTNSDLDIVVEYDGDISEDSLFNILNEDPMYIDDIQVDINPITASKTGTLSEYLERSNAYDQEILSEPDTKYSLSTTDNQGRELSQQQQEYFKDSKIRDENGNLLTVYHGTRNDFTVFDRDMLASGSGDYGYLGDGFYFATHMGEAKYYGSNIMEVYLDVKNPFDIQTLSYYDGKRVFSESGPEYIEITNLVKMNPEWGNVKINNTTYGEIADEFNRIKNNIKVDFLNSGTDINGEAVNYYKIKFKGEEEIKMTTSDYTLESVKADAIYDELMKKFGYINNQDVIQYITEDSIFNKTKSLSQVLQENGYDGIMQGNEARYTDEIVVFEANQIKNVNNLNPSFNEDIRYSLSEDVEKTINNAKKEFGITTDFREAGYITPDGELLDFSGKRNGGPLGKRSQDHREIGEIYTDEQYHSAENKYPNMGTATAIMQDFIDMGNIRVMPETNGFDLTLEPTQAQYNTLREYIDNSSDDIYVDINKHNGYYDSASYPAGTSSSKIINDLKTYFETGKFPKQSSTAQYRYSLSKINENDIAPVSDLNNIYGRDVAIQPEDVLLISEESVLELFDNKNQGREIPPNPTKETSYYPYAEKINRDPFMEYVARQVDDSMIAQNRDYTPKVNKSKLRNATDTFSRLFVNRNVEIDNLAKESGNRNIKITGDMLNNVYGEVDGNLTIAQTDSKGNVVGDSLRSLFQNSKDNGYYEVLDDYLKHYSNIDRHGQGKGSKVPLEYSEGMVAEYEKLYPYLKEDAEKIWKYGRNIIEDMKNEGLISDGLFNSLKEMYPHYVPYMQDTELTPYMSDTGEIKPKRVVKYAKGKAKYNQLMGIEEALTKYTYAYKKAIRQNELYKEIVSTLGHEVMIGADTRVDPTQLDESLYIDENGAFLTAYFDGVQRSVQISDDLYRSLKNDLENTVRDLEQRFELITKPIQKISQVRRNLLTTWSPSFLITNPLKDIQDAMFSSKYTKDMLKFYPSSFTELFRADTDLAKQFLSLYGSGNTMGEFNTDNLVNGQKNIKFLNNVAKLNSIIELAPRFAEFKASLKNGTSVQEAMYNAREVTTNFGRGGIIAKALNRNGATFLNASIQGFSKFVRNIKGENGVQGVVGALAKATVFGIIPAVFNHLAFGDDDEDYEALPDYIKDNYYLIKTSDGTFIRIPKGRMISVFGSAARRTLEYAQGEEDAFEGYLNNALDQIGPNNPLDENILSPLIQAFNNEAWYGGDLIPSRLQNLPAKEQYDEGTDKLSIFLGQLTGLSPYKINYVLDQYSGGIGDLLLPTITEEATSDGSLLAPIKDKFVVNSTTDNKYVSDIYDLNDELYKKSNSRYATDEDILMNKYIYSITSEMGQLYGEIREIQSNTNLSKEEKYNMAQAIKEQINSISKEGLDNYKNINKTSNYAIIGDKEYYTSTNDSGETTWSSVDSDELEAMNSLGMDLDEKSEYYLARNDISAIRDEAKNNEEESEITKQKVANRVVDTNLSDNQKYYLYDKYYGTTETLDILSNIGIPADEFIMYDSQNFTADKNALGETISNSKKIKVFNYINSMNIDFEQKLILAKLQYNSYDEYNVEIINYLNSNPNISYDDEVYILEKMGFEVDEEGNIRW